jgi:cell division protein FtsA
MGKQQVERHMQGQMQSGSLGQVLQRMKSWFQGNF